MTGVASVEAKARASDETDVTIQNGGPRRTGLTDAQYD
jgi:hypothetical protein